MLQLSNGKPSRPSAFQALSEATERTAFSSVLLGCWCLLVRANDKKFARIFFISKVPAAQFASSIPRQTLA